MPNENDATPANPTWQVDYISIKQSDLVPEIINVTVKNTVLNSSSFKLYYYKSSSGTLTLQSSGSISANATVQSFSNALGALYPLANFNPTVTLTMYTSTKTVTLNATTAVYYEYLITIKRWRDTSAVATTVLPFVEAAYSSSVTISLKQSHSPPISGTFKLHINGNGVSVNGNLNIGYDVYEGSLSSGINSLYRSN